MKISEFQKMMDRQKKLFGDCEISFSVNGGNFNDHGGVDASFEDVHDEGPGEISITVSIVEDIIFRQDH